MFVKAGLNTLLNINIFWFILGGYLIQNIAHQYSKEVQQPKASLEKPLNFEILYGQAMRAR